MTSPGKINSKMKVAYYYDNQNVRIELEPVPKPGPGEILVQTKACGVCVADTMEWYLKGRAPLTLGHEPSGVVVETGAGVSKFKLGDRVAVHHHVSCLVCEQCLKGNFTMCETFKKTHIKPGGFGEYFIASALHVERDCHLLPEAMSFEVGTLIEPLACVIHAIKKAKIQAGQKVILIGTGVMGLMFIQALYAYGVRDLIVYEVLEWRKKVAEEFGAQHVLTPLQDIEKEKERVKQIFGSDGADTVFIAAKDLSAMRMGMQLATKGGTVLFFATPHPEEWIELYPSTLFFNELTITASYSADYKDTRIALKLLENGDINGSALITNRYPLDELSIAIQKTAGRDQSLKNIIVFD